MRSSLDLNTWAQNHGWAAAGVTAPVIDPLSQERYRLWLQTSKGPQMTYLERRISERLYPENYFEGLKSILCFALYYFPGWAQQSPKISNYAWDRDYHQRLHERLETTVRALKAELGEFAHRICVDTSPVLEKQLAVQAGIGWQGKNTLVLKKGVGSQIFLGEIFTDLPCDLFVKPTLATDHCGTCQRCLDACPTQALTPYQLNADQCISYWTLEHRGAFTSQTPQWKDWIAGCDICQEVCPWNQKLIPVDHPGEPSSPEAARTPSSPLTYVPEEDWQRNLRHIPQN